MYDKQLLEKTIAIHKECYGVIPTVVSYAPGRIEVLGNHTDYNAGTTFSCAINFGHFFCISKSDQPGIHVTAGDVRESYTFSADNDERIDSYWANYVKGNFYYLSTEHDIHVDGINCTFLGSIPMGAGLSSSAALEVATSYAAIAYAGKEIGTDINKTEIAQLAQKCENVFAGCNCGLLDQFSSIYGRDHGLIHSDFRSLETYTVALPDDCLFLMVNPRVKHSLAESPYNARRQSCEQAAHEMGTCLKRPIETLRDITVEEFEAHRDQLDPEAALCAAHIVGEIHRVERGVELLNEGHIEAFGQFLFDSHESSKNNFRNSCNELDIIVDAAQKAGALGARLSGGGWGGSAAVLVRANAAAQIRNQIIQTCKTAGFEPTVETIIPSAGASIL